MNQPRFMLDRWIAGAALLLLLWGLLMVASASMVISDQSYGQPFHYLIRQAVYVVIGLVAAGVAAWIPMSLWQKNNRVLMLVGLVLLLAVLIPGVGRSVNGSRRWLDFGVITLQVSELVKLFAIMYLAGYVERFHGKVQQDLQGFVIPMVVLGAMSVLLLLEPDFGAVSVLTVTFLGVLFLAQVRMLPFVVLFVLVALLLVVVAVSSPYRLERLVGFMHPWSNAYGSGYQLTQSLIAFGRGGLWGVGLGNSIQKLFYLPEAHTDFIFAVLGEELGLLGELTLLALYAILIGRMLMLARRAVTVGRVFCAYLVYGLAICLAVQCMINLGVNVGLLPTKGLTLPFISYGGSSILVNCFIVGLLLRVAHEMKAVGS